MLPEFTFMHTCVAVTHRIACVAGKFSSHVDTWDAINNQQYLSLEAVQHLLSQLGSVSHAPPLESPAYMVLKKKRDYEVRRSVTCTVCYAVLQ